MSGINALVARIVPHFIFNHQLALMYTLTIVFLTDGVQDVYTNFLSSMSIVQRAVGDLLDALEYLIDMKFIHNITIKSISIEQQ
jgi:hypothetical protein